MTLKELNRIAEKGENQTVEFKKKVDFPEKVVKEVVAFANTKGGNLFIGIEDDGLISGLKYPDEETYSLNNAIESMCKPKINYQIHKISISKKRSVLHYKIFSNGTRPHIVLSDSGESNAYIRVDDKSIKASREIKAVIGGRNHPKDIKFTYGDYESMLMHYLQDNESITLNQFVESTGLSKKKASKILVTLVLANVLTVEPGEKEDQYQPLVTE